MPPEAVAVELWYDRVVSGTYPLSVIGMSIEQVAQHAMDEHMPEPVALEVEARGLLRLGVVQ